MRKLLLLLTIGMLYTAQGQIISPRLFEDGTTAEDIKELYGAGEYSYDEDDDLHTLEYKRKEDGTSVTVEFIFKSAETWYGSDTTELVYQDYSYRYTYKTKEDWNFKHYNTFRYSGFTKLSGTDPKGSLSDHKVTWKTDDSREIDCRVYVTSRWNSSKKDYIRNHRATITIEKQKF